MSGEVASGAAAGGAGATRADEVLRALAALAFVYFWIVTFVLFGNSLWRDEAWTAVLVRRPVGEIIAVMARDTNPPLHPLLLRGLVVLFGESEIVLRSLSAVSVAGAGAIVRRLLPAGPTRDAATVAFFSSSVAQWYAAEARYYGLFMFTAAAAAATTAWVLRRDRLAARVVWVAAHLAVVHTHSMGIFVVAASVATLVLARVRARTGRARPLARDALALAAVAAGAVPWFSIAARQWQTVRATRFWLAFHPWHSLHETVLALGAELENVAHAPRALWIPAIVTFALLARGAGVMVRARRADILVALLLPLALTYVASFVQPLLYIRYVAFLTPWVAALVGMGVAASDNRIRAAGLASVLLLHVWPFATEWTSGAVKPPFAALARRVAAAGGAGMVFANDQEYSFFQCEYYLGNCFIVGTYDRLDPAVGLALIPRERVLSAAALAPMPRLGLVYWNDTRPDLEELRAHRWVETIRFATRRDRLNVGLLERTDAGTK